MVPQQIYPTFRMFMQYLVLHPGLPYLADHLFLILPSSFPLYARHHHHHHAPPPLQLLQLCLVLRPQFHIPLLQLLQLLLLLLQDVDPLHQLLLSPLLLVKAVRLK